MPMDEIKRILLVTGEYPPMQGGVADYTRELARAFVRAGREVGILTSTQATPPVGDADVAIFPHIEHWGWGLWDALDAFTADWQPDVVHFQYQTAAYGMHPAVNLWAWRPWSQRPRAVTAVTFHDLLPPYLFPKAHWLGLRRWVTHTLARTLDIAITTNPKDTAQLRPIRPDVIEIPIGSNIPDASPEGVDRASWRARWGVPEDAALICYFGFLNASKGGEMLVDVLNALVAEGRNAHLLMIGGRVGASDPTNRAYLEKVEARIAANGVVDRVHWTGHIPAQQVSAAFHISDVCLLPYQDGASYRRGSFMAALEHGMAIVTTPPALPYPDLEDGETLLYAPPDDVQSMAAAVARVIADESLRQRLGRHAKALSRQFGWDAIAAACLRAYEGEYAP
ncbi:MAG TPA: glycosyltransferase family 1 protein [Caldilineales bacterium]|nr:glycosyltransferase family 1 protein [Caldilineales bacterium]